MVEVEVLKPSRWLLLAFLRKYNIRDNKVGRHSQEEGHGFDFDLGPCSPCACSPGIPASCHSPKTSTLLVANSKLSVGLNVSVNGFALRYSSWDYIVPGCVLHRCQDTLNCSEDKQI